MPCEAFAFFFVLVPGFLLIVLIGLMIFWSSELSRSSLQRKIVKLVHKIGYGKIGDEKRAVQN